MKQNTYERLDEMEQIIKRPDFRENKGLGNEVGYYIFDYPAKDELIVRDRIEYLKKKNFKITDGFKLIVFDLYDLVIDILEQEDVLEQCYRFEKKKGMERIIKSVSSLLKLTEDDCLLIEYIKEHTPEKAVVVLTGVGKCYPILRSHSLLNNLHLAIDRVPVVLFYPGEYDGQSLALFSEIKDGNYYRAFKLVK